MQAERGGGGDVDVRRSGIVERDAEHLAGFAGGDRIALRLVDPVLALRRLARVAQIEDAADGAVDVDRGAIGARRGAGEARGESFAGLQALRQAGAGGERQQQQSGGAEQFRSTFGKMVGYDGGGHWSASSLEICFCPTTTTSGQPGCDA